MGRFWALPGSRLPDVFFQMLKDVRQGRYDASLPFANLLATHHKAVGRAAFSRAPSRVVVDESPASVVKMIELMLACPSVLTHTVGRRSSRILEGSLPLRACKVRPFAFALPHEVGFVWRHTSAAAGSGGLLIDTCFLDPLEPL